MDKMNEMGEGNVIKMGGWGCKGRGHNEACKGCVKKTEKKIKPQG